MGKIFYKITAAIVCLLIMMFCSSGDSLADMQEAELFEKAYEYYLNYNPEKALETFDLFLQQFPDSSALDSILFWRAKSLMQIKRAEEAAKSFQKLREVFPESSYSKFAEKELETLRTMPQKVDKSDAVREKTANTSDAKIPVYEDRIRKLETEKIDLEKQLSDVEKKRQLTEKGLSKALDDKNVLESQLEGAQKKQEELVKVSALNEKELIKLKAEKTELDARFRDVDKKQNEADSVIKKISAEKQVIEVQLKEQQARLAKSQETIALLEETLKGSEQEKSKQLQDLEARAMKAKDALAQLEGAQKKQEELVKVSALNEKELVKLKAEKTELDARFRDVDKKQNEADSVIKKISDEKQVIEVQLKEQQARLAKSQETIALLEETLKGSEQEKSKQLQDLEARAMKAKDALAQLEGAQKKQEELVKVSALNEKELIKLKAEKTELDARFRDVDKKQNEADSAIKKISAEKQVIEVQLKEQQARLAKSQETIALLEETLKGSEQEKSQVSKLIADKGAMERELKEGREALAAMKPVKEAHVLLQTEVDQMKTQKQQIQTELTELKRVNEQYAKRNAELAGEVSALKTQSLDYEKPFLRIGKERYTLAMVMREGTIAKNVTDKIQVKNVHWRTGNIIDDFIAEQTLARKAQEEIFSADSSVKESLMKQYALTTAEGAYLDKYLAIDRLVKKRLAVPAVTEKEAKAYYDKHREQYLHGRENRIRVLSLKYGKADELEKSLIAVEMREEALEGRPFDVIARKRPAIAAMKEMSLSRLPDWARTNLANLKEGEISNIISADNEFMIIQAIPAKPAYWSFEEVRKEIEKKLSAERSGQKQSLEDWLNSLKKDVEFLR